MDSAACVEEVLSSFEAHQIQLVEWGNHLLRRLGYPAVTSDLVYLVPDMQLSRACQIATAKRLRLVRRDQYLPSYASDFANVGFYFLLNDYSPHDYLSRRLILLPMSWTGLNSDELSLIPVTGDTPPPPGNVLTVSRAATCAAFVRMAAREHRGNDARGIHISDLSKVLTYGLFDMSYEGDYMEFKADDEPETEAERLERERAVDEIRRWSWRDDESWIGDALKVIVVGKAKYEDLPYR
ncbi:MAG: hypothetical protein M1816_004958 [Peltula sp. TS41687]|nr:MAG: hypothetical protein M1816_004958 [Peltula sp. TS41687]